MRVYWGQKVSEEFCKRVIEIAAGFDWDPIQVNHLMSCMAFESGETFSPSIKNMAGSGATGLIQFMPATAESLGTSTDELAEMTAIDQLDYVEAYFAPYHKRIKSLSDTYMAIFMPKYVGTPDNQTIFRAPGAIYRQNAGLDTDNDGVVTKGEIAKHIVQKYTKGEKYIREVNV